MDAVTLNKRIDELDVLIQKYGKEIDDLQDKRSECLMEKFKLRKIYNAERLKNMSINKDMVIVGFSKRQDYHFTMMESFVVLEAGSINHISTVSHAYRCDDFDYSYKTSQTNITIDTIINMFDEFDVYVLPIAEYHSLLAKMAMLEINIDNLSDIADEYANKAIKQLNN